VKLIKAELDPVVGQNEDMSVGQQTMTTAPHTHRPVLLDGHLDEVCDDT